MTAPVIVLKSTSEGVVVVEAPEVVVVAVELLTNPPPGIAAENHRFHIDHVGGRMTYRITGPGMYPGTYVAHKEEVTSQIAS